MTDPSLLVSSPTVTDPGLAPAGRHSYYVLAPTPNQTSGIDWEVVGPRYREELLHRLDALGYKGFADAIEVEHVTTPLDWERQGLVDGTPFSYSHTFRQTGPFRPTNLDPHVEGVVLAGSGTRPGIGVPMVLLSGRLAAERVVGR
jgi:phytoene desaturase